MITGERNYRRFEFPFTASQWEELEQQVLTYRYLMSGLPVPPGLMSTLITTPSHSSLFPQQQPLPLGLGCFQVGYGRKTDPEPGRCKRTDGKKWRCSKEAHPDSKYCEKHMHRSKAKAKKQFDVFINNNNNSATKTPNNHTTSSSTAFKSCLPYPAISSSSSSSVSSSQNSFLSYGNKIQNDSNFYPFLPAHSSSLSNISLSTQENDSGPHWLHLDGEFHGQPVKKAIRHCNEIKGVVNERMWNNLEASKMKVTCSSSSRCSDLTCQDIGYENHKGHDEEESAGIDREHESQKLFHHFLGDWPLKVESSQSHAVGVLSRSK